MVTGAQLNAALANATENGLRGNSSDQIADSEAK
jgi:hypothetical protein